MQNRRHTDPETVYNAAVNVMVYGALLLASLSATVTIIRFIVGVLT